MLTTTTPFGTLLDRMFTLSRAMDSGLDNEFGANSRPQLWLPAVDTYELTDAFVVEADLPGVHPENVDVSFEQNVLTIKGSRGPTIQTPEKGELRVYTAERLTGQFARSIRLPEYVEGDKIEASFAHGVLTVRVPKAAAAKPRKIAIRAHGDQKQIESR